MTEKKNATNQITLFRLLIRVAVNLVLLLFTLSALFYLSGTALTLFNIYFTADPPIAPQGDLNILIGAIGCVLLIFIVIYADWKVIRSLYRNAKYYNQIRAEKLRIQHITKSNTKPNPDEDTLMLGHLENDIEQQAKS